jgi:hypothetical protein
MVERVLQFQTQTSSFLTAAVSLLCFTGKEPPDEAVVQHIFDQYIAPLPESDVIKFQSPKLVLWGKQLEYSHMLKTVLLRLLLKPDPL